jgi:hypothetical protein
MPSVLALLRLITNSNTVGLSIGSSEGFAQPPDHRRAGQPEALRLAKISKAPGHYRDHVRSEFRAERGQRGMFADIGIMLALRLAMIHTEPVITRKTIRMPKARARILFV